MENSDGDRDEEDDRSPETQSPFSTNTLRIIKVVSLLLIGTCALLGMAFSKITFVSVSNRMYTALYSHPSVQDDENTTIVHKSDKSKIFFQLIFMLVIPEIVCLSYCLLWGVIGKSSKSKPWPSWSATCLVSF